MKNIKEVQAILACAGKKKEEIMVEVQQLLQNTSYQQYIEEYKNRELSNNV